MKKLIFVLCSILLFAYGADAQQAGAPSGSNYVPQHGHKGPLDGGALYLSSGMRYATVPSVGPATLTSINVTTGDTFISCCYAQTSYTTSPTYYSVGMGKTTGDTATIIDASGLFTIGTLPGGLVDDIAKTWIANGCTIWRVTASGSLRFFAQQSIGTGSAGASNLATSVTMMFFLKQ